MRYPHHTHKKPPRNIIFLSNSHLSFTEIMGINTKHRLSYLFTHLFTFSCGDLFFLGHCLMTKFLVGSTLFSEYHSLPFYYSEDILDMDSLMFII